MILSKKLMNEAKGRPPSQSSYLDAVLRANRKKNKKFGTASKTRLRRGKKK